MLRSMTGFGRCLVESEGFTQQWEVKSVNSRHLDLKWRLPMSVRSLEPRLEKVVRRFASRGRVDISLTLQYTGGTGPAPRFDAMQADAMLDSLKELAARRGETFTPDYNALLALPALWGDAGDEVDEGLTLALEEGLSLALEDWNDARAAEGRALARDMHSRILRMEEWTGLIAERAPEIKEERAAVMRERLNEALEAVNGLDENRFLQEVTILADRLDVTACIPTLPVCTSCWMPARMPAAAWTSRCRNASARSTPAATRSPTCSFRAWWSISRTNWKSAASRSRTSNSRRYAVTVVRH